MQPTLGMTAHIFHAVGDERRAAELAAEAIERLRGMSQLAFAGVELHYLTWVASGLGRAAEVSEFAERDPVDSDWLRAVRAVAAGDLRRAAEIYDEMGALSAAAPGSF